MCKFVNMEGIKIIPRKTYTKSAYHKKFSVSRPTIDRMIKDKELDTVHVNGVVLIVL